MRMLFIGCTVVRGEPQQQQAPNECTCLCESQDLFGKLTMCVFSSPMKCSLQTPVLFISLCIVYSNIGHRAHKSPPMLCQDSAICMHRFNRQHPLPINVFSPARSLSLPLSARLCPFGNALTDPCSGRALKTNYVVFFK